MNSNPIKGKSWLELLIVPVTIAIIGGMFTFVMNFSQQNSAREISQANLSAEYTKIFMSEYRNLDNPRSREVLQATAGIMKQLELTGADIFYNLAQAEEEIAAETKSPQLTGYENRPAKDIDCRDRPKGTICLKFKDGYVMLIRGAVLGWRTTTDNGRDIQIAISTRNHYYHILGTDSIKVVPQMTGSRAD